MKTKRTWIAGAVTALTLIGGQAMAGSVVFSDNFDSEGGGVIRYNGFTNWTVSEGSVDLIGAGTSYNFLPGNGKYVDLDGTSRNAGTLSLTGGLDLDAGIYQLAFDLAGNHRNNATDQVTVSFGSVSDIFSVARNDDFKTFVLDLTLNAASTVDVVFDHSGGDNIGMLLDNVVVSRVGDVTVEPVLNLIDLAQDPFEPVKDLVKPVHAPTPTAAAGGLILLGLLNLKRRWLT